MNRVYEIQNCEATRICILAVNDNVLFCDIASQIQLQSVKNVNECEFREPKRVSLEDPSATMFKSVAGRDQTRCVKSGEFGRESIGSCARIAQTTFNPDHHITGTSVWRVR
ncbi:hypothetical protein K0M31_015862 [Melipona bicolor]|uniref:Uncharacterized protein n=1 Tax=Melipona bicolor TaxID=60889 RepID=A0AA40G630_9HYME|nr:hypothetical protein K0M31_015862 [Melipona bicolor]